MFILFNSCGKNRCFSLYISTDINGTHRGLLCCVLAASSRSQQGYSHRRAARTRLSELMTGLWEDPSPQRDSPGLTRPVRDLCCVPEDAHRHVMASHEQRYWLRLWLQFISEQPWRFARGISQSLLNKVSRRPYNVLFTSLKKAVRRGAKGWQLSKCSPYSPAQQIMTRCLSRDGVAKRNRHNDFLAITATPALNHGTKK